MTNRPARHRRNRPMNEIEVTELMGCILIGALIVGILAGPIAYLVLTHL